jgi:hypothetical protein
VLCLWVVVDSTDPHRFEMVQPIKWANRGLRTIRLKLRTQCTRRNFSRVESYPTGRMSKNIEKRRIQMAFIELESKGTFETSEKGSELT